MRRLAVWLSGGLLLVAVGACGGVRAGEPDTKPATKTNWYGPTWQWGSKPAARKAAPKSTRPAPKEKPAEKTDKTAASGPTKPSSLAAQRAVEETEYHRRIAVCDRLLQIATQNSDDELRQLAEELSERAWTVYQQRTANLTSVHTADVDAALLEKNVPLGPYGAELKARGGIPRRAPTSEFSRGPRASVEEKR